MLLVLAGPVFGGDTTVDGATSKPSGAVMKTAADDAISLFKKYISPIDGDRCPMHPTCSQYSSNAFQKHGAIMGWIMTCDRLMRCGRNELAVSPRIFVNGKPKCHDPVESNDFWWTE
ncbi:MAG: membrane protein insertion efficiency factor YidD [Thermodesulfobacteriota bacterium]|nr:membrane protein insertion efficiency factor YidD [Thermodesulfobacteriota bacterium]